MALAQGATPFTKFSVGVTGLVHQLGMPQEYGLCIMTMFVSALALTSLDAVARIGIDQSGFCCTYWSYVFPGIL